MSLFTEVALIQGCPYREVSLYIHDIAEVYICNVRDRQSYDGDIGWIYWTV